MRLLFVYRRPRAVHLVVVKGLLGPARAACAQQVVAAIDELVAVWSSDLDRLSRAGPS